MMFFNKPKPLFHIGSFPISVVGLIILIQLIGMIIYAVTGGSVLEGTVFLPQAFTGGEPWRLLTYPLVSPIRIMTLIGLFFFYQFGTAVEASLERRPFILLVCSVLLVTPIVFTLFYLLKLPSSPLFGTHVLSLAIFCTFCVMHPNLPSFFQIPVKWLGVAFFLISVLGAVTLRDWAMVVSYVLATGLAIWMVQSKGLAGLKIFPDSMLAEPSKKKRPTGKKKKGASQKKKVSAPTRRKTATPARTPKMKPQVSLPDDTEIDVILDKINEEGLHSLTQEERAKLESVSKTKNS